MTRAVPIYDHQGECVWVWVCVSECMRVFGQGTDDQVRRKRTSLLKVLEKRGVEKGRREVLGYLKKDQGLFSSTLYPGTDLCWMERGVASLPWVPGRSLLLTLDWIPLSWLSPSEVFPDELSCKSMGNKNWPTLYNTLPIIHDLLLHTIQMGKKGTFHRETTFLNLIYSCWLKVKSQSVLF